MREVFTSNAWWGPLREVSRVMHGEPFEGSFLRCMVGPSEGSFLRVMHGGPLRKVLRVMHGGRLREVFYT